jgi:hypothetical protein
MTTVLFHPFPAKGLAAPMLAMPQQPVRFPDLRGMDAFTERLMIRLPVRRSLVLAGSVEPPPRRQRPFGHAHRSHADGRSA